MELDRFERERVTVWVRAESLRDESEVRAWMGRVGGEGWVCCTSATPTAWTGEFPTGRVLSAEIVSSGVTLTVRYSDDAWRVTMAAEHAFDGATKSAACVAFDDEYVSSLERPRGAARARLRYRTYWRETKQDPVLEWRPWMSRFDGWEKT